MFVPDTARSGTKALNEASEEDVADDDELEAETPLGLLGSSVKRMADSMESTAKPPPPEELAGPDEPEARGVDNGVDAEDAVAGDADCRSNGFRGPARLKGLLEYAASATGGRLMLPSGTPSPT